MICVPIVGQTMGQARARLAAAAQTAAHLVELRLDCLTERPDLPALQSLCPKPTIATCRAAREGGHWQRTEEERLALLQQAVDLGFAYVDVEADVVQRLRAHGVTKIIASYHNFHETPSDLAARARALEALPCDIIKFATLATRLRDNLRLFAALQAATKPAIGMCMGELGEISRILNLRYGSLLTFGSLEPGLESAPGQLTVEDLSRLYRAPYITSDTALYGVVGNPIAHSMSPEIHNTAMVALGVDAVYLRFRVESFASFLTEVAAPLGLNGLSVTIPHKDAALRAATQVEPLAQRIGAVNTLTATPQGWHGSNTDCAAALEAIRNAAARAGLSLAAARALVLGAGGTARALAFGLAQAGCDLTLANRTRSRAEALAQEVGAAVLDLSAVSRQTWDVIANTTSVGMHPHTDATPVSEAVFHRGMVAFDAVYNPRRTRFLSAASTRGAEVADGVEMFVGQAVGQFEAWTGKQAPRQAMQEVVLRRLGQT